MADDSNAKKNKLLELANRKRKEAEEVQEREAQERSKKLRESLAVDFGDASDEEDQGPTEEAPPGQAPVAAVDFGDDEDEVDNVVTDADRAFIDDDGVAPEERVDFGDEDEDALGMAYDEAEEAAEDMEDELDRMFGRRKREQTGNEAENRATVENLLAQMEVAVEEDMQAFAAEKPATNKLRMLSRVQEVLAMKKLHGELLDAGLLGVLKAWIEPMEDGTLPNSKVRGAVLTMLTRLPVDCSFEDRREQLKRSGLGRVVMFLSKLPDETTENRRMARELVQKWSRPILAPRGVAAVDQSEQDRILEARQRRQQAQKQPSDANEDGMPALRPGMPGYRLHATIPQAASLDYIRRPESKAVMVPKRGGKASEHKITKKLKTLGKRESSRAANVSVQGRDVTLQH